MKIELVPDAPANERAAAEAALVAAQVSPGAGSSPYAAAWRRAALGEGVERAPGPQAPSPRSSRGAKRA